MLPENVLDELLQWLWALMAIAFFIAEIFTAGFVLACFGLGALAAAGAALLGLSLSWQLGTFIATSLAAALLSRPFAERVTRSRQGGGVGVDRVLGKRAIVLEAIDSRTGSGRVRVGAEEWRAESVGAGPIPAGAAVEVLAVEGTRLQVRPLVEQS